MSFLVLVQHNTAKLFVCELFIMCEVKVITIIHMQKKKERKGVNLNHRIAYQSYTYIHFRQMLYFTYFVFFFKNLILMCIMLHKMCGCCIAQQNLIFVSSCSVQV